MIHSLLFHLVTVLAQQEQESDGYAKRFICEEESSDSKKADRKVSESGINQHRKNLMQGIVRYNKTGHVPRAGDLFKIVS